MIDKAFAAAGVERTVTLEVADLGTAAAYIRKGLGIGFLSWSILDDIDDAGLVTVPVADQELCWRLYVATSATRPTSAAVRALLSRRERRRCGTARCAISVRSPGPARTGAYPASARWTSARSSNCPTGHMWRFSGTRSAMPRWAPTRTTRRSRCR